MSKQELTPQTSSAVAAQLELDNLLVLAKLHNANIKYEECDCGTRTINGYNKGDEETPIFSIVETLEERDERMPEETRSAILENVAREYNAAAEMLELRENQSTSIQ